MFLLYLNPGVIEQHTAAAAVNSSLVDFKQFLQVQISVIEGKWRDLNLEQSKKAELIPYRVVYRTLIGIIAGPKEAKTNLEKNLQQLIDK